MNLLAKSFLFIFILLTQLLCQGQFETTNLSINNVNATVNTKGLLFNDFMNSLAGFEVPSGTGLHTIFASQLWMGGMDNENNLHLVADKYGNNGNEFYQGPLTADGTSTTNSTQMLLYNRFWEAHYSDVEMHIAYHTALINGTQDIEFPNGYTIPDWMMEWPAHGNPEENQAFNLAPYVDVNSNLFYDPENGDYPHFPGDVCIYYIMNDKGGIHNNSGGQALGVEIHVMIYAYDAIGALGNSIFASYRIINRSNTTYTDCYVGNWTDLDIGTPTDDYIGCDVANGFYYGFNGDGNDEASSVSSGYGTQTPIQSVIFLGGPTLDADGLDNELPASLAGYDTYGGYGPGYDDGVIDNERLGMSSFRYYNNSTNPVTGEPTTALHYYNLLSGKWKDGSHLMYGGNGSSGSGVTTTETLYAFPGNSDVESYATDGNVMDEWSEATAFNLPGDRRGLASAGPFTLDPGEVVDLDICYMYANEGNSGFDELTYAQNQLSQIRNHYEDELLGKYNLQVYTSVDETYSKTTTFELFPNPAHDQFQINTANENLKYLEVQDMTGQIVDRMAFRRSVKYATDHLPDGIYMLVVTDNQQKSMTRLVKQ
ncbi:MAG: T9SS type A sorting domain-containing protein [Flavobacteriales bacterium]|nr:T9SS type A sorting domain-containing protein [Flavobacteriales bacterium]